MCKWQEAEHQLANMVKGKVVTELALQYKDIDVITSNYTYSVKHQNKVVEYDSLLFELTLQNTDNGRKMDGSFLKCEAARYAIKFDDTWLMFDTNLLKSFILERRDTLKERVTQRWLEDKNKAEGRTYNRGIMVSLNPKDLISSPAYITGYNIPEKYNVRNK